MVRRRVPHAAGPAHRLRENHCLCQNCRGLRAQGKPGADSGTPGGAAGTGCRQDFEIYRPALRRGKGRGKLPFQLVPDHRGQRSDPHAGKAAAPVFPGLFRHYHHRRSPPLYQRQLPPDSGLFPGRRGTGRHRHPRPGRHEGPGAGVPVSCL